MGFLRILVANMLGVLVGEWLLTGVHVDGHWWNVVVVALVLAFLNAIVRPILIFLTIPATIVTFGLFILVINAVTILLGDYLLSGFNVDGFWWALGFSLILSIITSIFSRIEKDAKKNRRSHA